MSAYRGFQSTLNVIFSGPQNPVLHSWYQLKLRLMWCLNCLREWNKETKKWNLGHGIYLGFNLLPLYTVQLFSTYHLYYTLSLPRSLSLSGNHSQISRAIVAIRVQDINDNAPEFAAEYEAFVCENSKPGQVRRIYQGCQWRIPHPPLPSTTPQ